MKILLGLWLSLVIVAALAFPIVPVPQQWYEFPVIPGLEDKARILFFHVPMSWVTVVAFMVSMIYGIKYLAKKNLDDDVKSVSSASLGLVFCLLATITGSIWAKFNWGSFWNWDPRETSIFMLLLIYGAYFALRSALDVEEKRATLSAVYSIIAGVTVPFFIFIMPRIIASLHPEPIVNAQGKVHMNGTMLVVFLSSLAGFTALYWWMFTLKVRAQRLENKSLR
ncbi:MAG: cytochrome c biogenesis protein CcsA [Bacteroidota bacterium]|jgi:heme exporter protein C